jgi:hypothetical protein
MEQTEIIKYIQELYKITEKQSQDIVNLQKQINERQKETITLRFLLLVITHAICLSSSEDKNTLKKNIIKHLKISSQLGVDLHNPLYLEYLDEILNVIQQADKSNFAHVEQTVRDLINKWNVGNP